MSDCGAGNCSAWFASPAPEAAAFGRSDTWAVSCYRKNVVCTVCGASNFQLLRSAADVQRESFVRSAFVEARTGHVPRGLEGMDLTQFMHGAPAEVLLCTNCGTLRRQDEQPARYESDRYDAALLQHLYPRYREAFERKRPNYKALLEPRANILEVGSHIGAFLEVAERWDWKPIGLDIGADTAAFAKKQGATVKRKALPDYSPRSPIDAVFFWNCFEQLEDPSRTLAVARRLLAKHGLVVLRVPNGDYYRTRLGDRTALPSLGYNNLLAFPYLNGYTADSLQRLLRSIGFEPVANFAATLLTPPYPEMTASLRKEWQTLRIDVEQAPIRESPWIEAVGRAIS